MISFGLTEQSHQMYVSYYSSSEALVNWFMHHEINLRSNQNFGTG